MQLGTREVSTVRSWGPVRRGFSVAFADGECGRLDEIRVADGTVELVVRTGSVGRLVAVDGDDVEAILPRRRRIVLGSLSSDDAAGTDAAGGIVRLPMRHSSRIADASPAA